MGTEWGLEQLGIDEGSLSVGWDLRSLQPNHSMVLWIIGSKSYEEQLGGPQNKKDVELLE